MRIVVCFSWHGMYVNKYNKIVAAEYICVTVIKIRLYIIKLKNPVSLLASKLEEF